MSPQNIDISIKDQNIYILFPESVVSSVTSDIQRAFKSFRESDTFKQSKCEKIIFVFKHTDMIDSMGLNLLKSILDWSKVNNLSIDAEVYSEFIHMILQSVWLDREIKIIEKY